MGSQTNEPNMKKFLSITHKSLSDLGVTNHQELWTKAQSEGYAGISVHLDTEYVKSADVENRFHAIFSSANEDRHGDIVEQEFDLKNFKKNPVFLDSHNYFSIEAIIGRVVPNTIKVEKGKLQGDIEFALDNPRGALAAKLADAGFLGATSIGFIPREFNEKGYITKSELLEVSAVSVPANADAIFEKSIEPEKPVVEEPAPEVQTEEEEHPEPDLQADVRKVDPKRIAAKAVSDMVTVRRSHLKALTKAVHELTEDNKQSQRRKIHQAVRRILG